jgi:hypothetical protein
MQGGKNWILTKKINKNRFFWDSYWLEIWSNHFCPSMGPNGGSVATDSEKGSLHSRLCIVKTSFGHIPSIKQRKIDVFITVI